MCNEIEAAAAILNKYKYKYDIQGERCLRVYYKDGSGEYTQITPCNDQRPSYYMIEGKVQNIIEWAAMEC